MLQKDFYLQNSLDVAKALLGKVLVREVDGKVLKCRIVETESYLGIGDKACHANNNKRTKRVEPLYEDGGIAYVYFIYGLYHCFNIVTGHKNHAECVLIRAVEPLNELDYISNIRFKTSYDNLTSYQKKNLTNGPSKFCLSYKIDREDNFKVLHSNSNLYLIDDGYHDFEIVESKRIGIDYSEEAKDFLFRFYIKDNKYVSKK